jgi:hypothetical protein
MRQIDHWLHDTGTIISTGISNPIQAIEMRQALNQRLINLLFKRPDAEPFQAAVFKMSQRSKGLLSAFAELNTFDLFRQLI